MTSLLVCQPTHRSRVMKRVELNAILMLTSDAFRPFASFVLTMQFWFTPFGTLLRKSRAAPKMSSKLEAVKNRRPPLFSSP